ncbi:hypothetical protein [Streptomyces sp. NBC_00069]|uniref:hypothetical protein n=1 Tax=Streptomyces sp. NBC_00069 TaxID=2975639 RepID=UPI00324586FD|nr:hypothetical protein OG513_33085 [Streptomyces sp. NBC_00998]
MSIYANGTWNGVTPRNVPDSGNRRGEKLVPGTQKIVIGCMEMGPADSADDLPIG